MFIRLSNDTHVALMRLAVDERRDTRREAEHLIEVALKRRGLLKLDTRTAVEQAKQTATREGVVSS